MAILAMIFLIASVVLGWRAGYISMKYFREGLNIRYGRLTLKQIRKAERLKENEPFKPVLLKLKKACLLSLAMFYTAIVLLALSFIIH